MTPPQPSADLFRSAEFRIVVALALSLAALVFVGVRIVGDHTDYVMLDFRDWRPVSSHSDRPQAFFEEIQTPFPAQRPFRLTLQLERIPQAGDFFAAEREFSGREDRTYCFEVMTYSDYFNPESRAAIQTFEVSVSVNGVVAASFPIADRRWGDVVRVQDIRPLDGKIAIRFEVRARRTRFRESWRRASAVHFEYARLHRCNPGEASG